METCKTVRVKADNESGYMVINEVDFDPKKHEKYEEEETEGGGAKAPADMTVKELKAALKAKGVEFDSKAAHDELVALLEQAE